MARRTESVPLPPITDEKKEEAWAKGVARCREAWGDLLQRGPSYQSARDWFEAWIAHPPASAVNEAGQLRPEDVVRAAWYAMTAQMEQDHGFRSYKES